MNHLRPLENWDRGFESHSRRRCLCAFVLCVGSGLATRWSPVQGVLPTVYRLRNWKSGQGPTKGCRTIDRQIDISRYWYRPTVHLKELQDNKLLNKIHGRMCSRGSRLKSRPRNWLSWRCAISVNPSTQISVQYQKSYYILANSSFTNYPINRQLCNLRYCFI
jgi:hypothetical protein